MVYSLDSCSVPPHHQLPRQGLHSSWSVLLEQVLYLHSHTTLVLLLDYSVTDSQIVVPRPAVLASSWNLSEMKIFGPHPGPTPEETGLGDQQLKKKLYLFTFFFFLSVLGLCCCMGFPLVAVSRDYSLLQWAGFSL